MRRPRSGCLPAAKLWYGQGVIPKPRKPIFKWLRQTLSGAPQLPEGVSRDWYDSLASLLKPVDTLTNSRDGLAEDIIGFVLYGEPIAVLHELSQRSGVFEYLHWAAWLGRIGKKERNPYEDFRDVPAPVALRWAKVVEATSAAGGAWTAGLVMPGQIRWPEALLRHAESALSMSGIDGRNRNSCLSATAFEAMLVEDGAPPQALIVSAFASPAGTGYRAGEAQKLVGALADFPEALARHAESIRPALDTAQAAQRLLILSLLDRAGADVLARFAPELSAMAVSSSKQVRAAAEPLLRKCAKDAIEPLRALAIDASADRRVHALRLLRAIARQHGDDVLEAFVRDTAKADKAPNVAALLTEWDEVITAQPVATTRYDYEMPVIEWACEMTPALGVALDQFWQEANAALAKSNRLRREAHAAAKAQGQKWKLEEQELLSDADRRALEASLMSKEARPRTRSRDDLDTWGLLDAPLTKLTSASGMTPVAALKTLAFLGLTRRHQQISWAVVSAFDSLHRASGRPTLLEVAELLRPYGYGAETILQTYCTRWGGALARNWPDAAVWPFFAHHLDLLVRNLSPAGEKGYWLDRAGLFAAIATLPTPPESIVNALFDLALGTAKSERPAAQQALASLPGKEARIIHALSDGKSEVRTVAAQWLGRLRHAPAQSALETAVAKEKQDVPKGAMLDALQALGQPVERYLDRHALAPEAAKTLAKGIPKELEWFPWAAMPPVRWADNREPVAEEILRAFIVQAFRQKSPEPNAVLRKYCAMFDPHDREAFGQFVLDSWLHEDVKPIPPDEAMTRAVNHARQMHGYMQSSPQYFQGDPNLGRSVEELTAAYLPSFLRQPAGSAIASKGILAVAAACAAERAAAPVARYLKDYYGTRAAHGKALIAMLAWIEHPAATQLMLAVGNRFRTKSFQEEATRQAEALAERKGWTLSELADRTIPSAGFDESGELELSYGQRSFTVRLLPDFKVELFNPEGRKITALPEPRQDDDQDLAKLSRKAFSATKKEIRSIVDLQTDRLYEALCTGRQWSFEDWSLYLNRHPVVRRLLQRLVWVQAEDGRVVRSFRPLDDGTLTDAEDNEVELAAAARVQLAHDSLLSAEDVARWQQHLADYEIAPLFQQIGKGVYALPPDRARDPELKDFEGHLLEAFALRGRALKLGYTRGQAEDGGWFHVYEKRFPTLGLVAVLEFTGNPLPETNRTVALLSLSFSSTAGESWERGRIALGEIPRVLLSECYNDVRLIAAEGTGFDPGWQKKSEY